jgi:hypothetical protein
MKHQLMMLSMACGLTLLFGTQAPAQSYKLASDVPFAFHVGGQNCPSGKYTVERAPSHDYQSIRGAKGGCSLFLGYGNPLSGNSQPKLVFHRYHDQYFLSEIWNDSRTGSRLSVSKQEQEAREQAQPSETASTTLYLTSSR